MHGPRLRRQPTDMEARSRADFALMDRLWHDAVNQALTDWSGVVAEQRSQIRQQIIAAVDSDDTDRLSDMRLDTSGGARLLETALLRYAQRAGEQMAAEARAQGVDVPPWRIPDSEADAVTAAAGRELLRSIARGTARILGLGLLRSATTRALQLIGVGRTGRQVADEVNRHLLSLTDAQPREAISAAMTAAQNEGRRVVLSVAPPATYVATEIMDLNVCAPCRSIDGTTFTTLERAQAAYPSGGYVRCLGGTRCRGTYVAVWDTAEVASAALATGGKMPYEIRESHGDCPEEEPFAVVKEGTGERMGCHATRESAEEQMRALYAAEEEDDLDDYLTAAADEGGETASWQGVLAVEGITTGDGREFSLDALTWAELPIPLRWNVEDSHGGAPHTVAVNVGRIDKIWRDDEKIMGSGVLDLSDDNGRRAYEKIKGGYLRGVSIDADSIGDADMEYVWPEGVADDAVSQMMAQPEKIIFNAGRIRAATLVDIPAFSEAYVALSAGAAAPAVEFTAVASHSTATSDGPWDGPAAETRLPSPMTVATARDAYAWIDMDGVEDGMLPKSAGRFIHHEVSADGNPGAANLTACSSGIGVLNGGRGGTTIPAADRRAVYNHLARHLRDADREPPPLQAATDEVVTASLALGWTPPAQWFRDPSLDCATPITIDAAGRLYGHAARWGECHIGQSGVCVAPPHEDSHPYFMTGELTCDDGSTVAVGQITVGTSHAPLSMGAAPAAQHYDHTGWAVADVVVGNDHHGIWVAGAVRPNADSMRVHELRAAGQVSGDWRRIGGQLRLVGLLGVNVPGFPVPKMRARVASGQQLALVAAGMPQVSPAVSEEDQDRAAMQRVMRMLSERVHGEGVSDDVQLP